MIANYKKQIIISLSGCLAITIIILLFFHVFSKADNHITDTKNHKKNNDYASITRDTEIRPEQNGNLNIVRNEPGNTSMGKENTWTIFLYLTGTDLETNYENATKDIKEMLHAKFNDSNKENLNIIIQTGGCEGWHSNKIANDKIQRYKVEKNKLVLLEEHSLASMGNPNTLYSFLNWGIKEYPAEHMAVLFWNHGSGVSQGVCCDELFDYDTLKVNEIEYCFSKLNSKLTSKFEVIGFDTCLSGSLEYANIFAPYAKYLIASADSEPGEGWFYTDFINHILTNPDSNGLDIGKIIVDTYTSFYKGTEAEPYTTMAVYDLSKVNELCSEINTFGKYMYELLDANPNMYKTIMEMNRDTLCYEDENIDIGALINYINTHSDFKYDTTNFNNALNEFIAYSKVGETYEKSSAKGVTLYWQPYAMCIATLNNYRNICFSPYWFKCLELLNAHHTDNLSKYVANNWETSQLFFEQNFDFLNYETDDIGDISEKAYKLLQTNSNYVADGFVIRWNNVSKDYFKAMQNNQFQFNNNVPFLEMSKSTPNSLSAKLTLKKEESNSVLSAYGSVYAKVKSKLACLGQNPNVDFDANTNQITSEFNGEWFMLPDGQLLTTYIISQTDNCTIYAFPVDIDGTESTIRIKEDIKNNKKKYTLLGVWDALESGPHSPRGFLPLDVGTTITPIYDIFDTENNTFDTEYGDAYTIRTDFDFLLTTLDDGEYAYAFSIKKLNGTAVQSNLIDFTIKDKQIQAKSSTN